MPKIAARGDELDALVAYIKSHGASRPPQQ